MRRAAHAHVQDMMSAALQECAQAHDAMRVLTRISQLFVRLEDGELQGLQLPTFLAVWSPVCERMLLRQQQVHPFTSMRSRLAVWQERGSRMDLMNFRV